MAMRTSYPQISPDGKWLIYESVSSGKLRIVKQSLDGGTPQPVTERTVSRPIISPDGKWIAVYFFDDTSKPV